MYILEVLTKPRLEPALGSEVDVGNTLGQTQGRTQGQETAILGYAGRNWGSRKGKFEIEFEGYKERNPGVE